MDTNEQVGKLIEDVRTLLEQGGRFVIEQAPPLAQEIVTQGRVLNTFWVAVGTIAMLAAGWNLRKAVKNDLLWDEYDGPKPRVMWFFPLIGGAIAFLATMRACVLAWFAPRLYLLEYVAELLRGKK